MVELNYWSWLDQWQSTNGMVSIFVAHNLVRSILVLVTYTLLTGGKEIIPRNGTTDACTPRSNQTIQKSNVTEPFRSVPFRKIMTTEPHGPRTSCPPTLYTSNAIVLGCPDQSYSASTPLNCKFQQQSYLLKSRASFLWHMTFLSQHRDYVYTYRICSLDFIYVDTKHMDT